MFSIVDTSSSFCIIYFDQISKKYLHENIIFTTTSTRTVTKPRNACANTSVQDGLGFLWNGPLSYLVQLSANKIRKRHIGAMNDSPQQEA